MQVKAMWRVEEKEFNNKVYGFQEDGTGQSEHTLMMKKILSIL